MPTILGATRMSRKIGVHVVLRVPSCPLWLKVLAAPEPLPQGAGERDERQGDNRNGQDGVGAQQGKVESPDGAAPGEASDAVVSVVPEMSVVPEITGEKKGGRRERRQHADLVRSDLFPANEEEPKAEQQGARGVQRGVQRGEIGKREHAEAVSESVISSNAAQSQKSQLESSKPNRPVFSTLFLADD